jgi:protein-disulfide isomerase
MSQLTIPVGSGDHVMGPLTAPVTLLEYGDYECPFCGAAYANVRSVQQQLGDRLCFVFRHFPLTTLHPRAEHASEAAEAAGAQGKFWEMHNLLFANQKALDEAHLLQYAGSLGLNPPQFEGDLLNHTFAEKVRGDFLGGIRSGVNGTPTFYINGQRHDGSYSAETLLAVLERAASLRQGPAAL